MINDLNRIAPGNIKSKDYEERRVAEIVEMSKNYNFVIDLHGSISNCGVVSIIPYPRLDNLFLARLLKIKRNIMWYSKKSLKNGQRKIFKIIK